jgi:hypothetical protein
MKYALILLLFLVIGCSSEEAKLSSISGVGNGSGNTIDTSGYYSVSVNVVNLGISPIIMSLNDETQLLIEADGTQTFSKKVKPDSEFEVKISSDPSDRNCVLDASTQKATGPSHTVNVVCGIGTNYFYSGNIQGLEASGLVVTVTPSSGTPESINISNGNKFWKTSGSYSGLITSVTITNQPAGQQCLFANASVGAQIIGGVYKYNIHCIPEQNTTYILSIQASGLSGSMDIVNHNNFVTIPSNGTHTFATVSQNTRHILEIVSVPVGQRCYFNQTKNHLYSEYLTSGYNHSIQVTCVPRSPCETAGVELPSVNGRLNDIECVSDKFVYGGSFSTLGRQLGVVRLNASASTPTVQGNTWDRIHGKVFRIASDEKNGIYVAGSFAKVGDITRRNLVHMPNFLMANENFDVGTNGAVIDVVASENFVYIFGRFTEVYIDGVTYPRNGFAKIDHTEKRPKISSLALPDGMSVHANGGLKSQIFDSSIYVHGLFMVNGVQKNLSVKMNKFSGTIITKETTLTEQNQTIFWQEPGTGKVWMIHKEAGIINPLTLASHPNDPSHTAVPLNHDYTLHNGNLYSSDGTKVRVTDLSLLASSTPSNFNFGKDSSGTVAIVKNVGYGFTSVGNAICFFQKPGTAEIIIGAGSTAADKKKGYVCFHTSGTLQTTNPGITFDATQGHLAGSNLILATPHYVSEKTNSLAVVNANGSYYAYSSGMGANDEVYTIANDDPEIIIGGRFSAFPGCASCTNIAKLNLTTTPTVDSSWTFGTPFNGTITKLSQQGGVLVGISEDPTRSVFGFDLTSGPAGITAASLAQTPLDIQNFGDSILLRETNQVTFREQTTLGSSPLTILTGETAIAKTTNRFITAFTSGKLVLHDLIGADVDETNVGSFTPSTVKLTSVGDRPCVYSGSNSVYCTDLGGVLKLSQSIPPERFTVFKSIQNAAILGTARSAPVVLVPDP